MGTEPVKQVTSEYLSTMMNRVSRSFALVVAWMEEPLQEEMSTAYLICRTLDNIEDCGKPFERQKEHFAEFHQLLRNPMQAEEILGGWERDIWPGLNADDAKLMTRDGGLALWQIYAALSREKRSMFAHWISIMANGMEGVLDPSRPQLMERRGEIRLVTTVQGYNDYCYYVAGTVGALGTELVGAHYGLEASGAERLLALGLACGRALQKTNILKDFADDLVDKVCYIPDEWLRSVDYAPLRLGGAPVAWSYAVVQDVLNELRDATQYVLAVPARAESYRVACLVCLLPAYQTILCAAQRRTKLFTADHQIKIDRETMALCVYEAVALASDDEGIAGRARELENEIYAAFGEMAGDSSLQRDLDQSMAARP